MTEEEIIVTHILGCGPIDLALNKPLLTGSQQEQFENLKRRRATGEPLQYILGTCNFMGLELEVNPSVLIPRPETEHLVEAALKHFKGGYALDLGTGSGNIAIALAKFVVQSQIIAVDNSLQALEVARANAKRHGVESRIHFIQEEFKFVTGTTFLKKIRACHEFSRNDTALFDLIISNPPYIPTSQLNSLPRDVQQEPVTALDGGIDGLNFYRIIIKYTPSLLRAGACLMMEFGDGQAQDVKNFFEEARAFSNISILKDLAGRDRIIKAIR